MLGALLLPKRWWRWWRGLVPVGYSWRTPAARRFIGADPLVWKRRQLPHRSKNPLWSDERRTPSDARNAPSALVAGRYPDVGAPAPPMSV
jgi:hypothetical protein